MATLISIAELRDRRCHARELGAAYSTAQAQLQLAELPDWNLEGQVIVRSFQFTDYFHTISFVNAIAWMIHAEDHHPDLTVSYNRCVVRFSTHSVNGLSENDFICAAKCDAIYDGAPGGN